MRTTVTLEEDVAQRLRETMAQSKVSFKQALNDALRRGLRGPRDDEDAFVVEARPMGLRAGLDPARLSDLAGELEEERFLALTRRLRGDGE
ncbi:MAG: antitoxin [Acidobacteriota bacterium]